MKRNFQKNKEQKPKDDFESKLLDLSRISHTRAGGRKIRFRATVIIGDKKGKIGFGISKGKDVALAVEKAIKIAKKKIIKVLIINDTIPYEVRAKFKAAKILLKPQKRGRGLVAGGTVRVVCSLVGIKNISSKMLGRTGNKLSNAMATITALKKLKIPNQKLKS